MILIAILALAGIVYFYNLRNPSPRDLAATALDGRITSVEEGRVSALTTIEGVEKIIELQVTPETIFTKEVIIITPEQAQSGESFAPRKAIMKGERADLREGMFVRVKANANLLKTDKAEALEINYITYDLPF